MTLFLKLRIWKNSGSPNRIGMKEETLTKTMTLTLMITWKLLTMLTKKLILTPTLMTLILKLSIWKNSGSANRIEMKK